MNDNCEVVCSHLILSFNGKAASSLLMSSLYKLVKYFGFSFAFDAAKIWNDLPNDVCSATSISPPGKMLKTYLFAKAYLP